MEPRPAAIGWVGRSHTLRAEEPLACIRTDLVFPLERRAELGLGVLFAVLTPFLF